MKRIILILLVLLAAWPVVALEKFLVCTGSSLELPAVREAAYGFDFLITGPYGYSKVRADTLLASKCIIYTSLMDFARYESREHDIQPSPQAMGHERMPLNWNADYGSFAYDLTDHWWPECYARSLEVFMLEEPAAGVLLDNWWPEHPWWSEMDPSHYARSHPDSLPRILKGMEVRLAAKAKELGKIVLLNGEALTDHPWPRRYWESFGWRGTWNTLGIWKRAQRGDFIYCSTGSAGDRWFVKIVGSMKHCPVGIGLPDGERLVDEAGELRIPRAEEF